YSTTDGLHIIDDDSTNSNAAYIPLNTTISSGTVTITGTIKISSDCSNAVNVVRFGASGVGIRYNGSNGFLLNNGSDSYTTDKISYTKGNDVTFTWVIDIDNNSETLTIGSSTITQTIASAQSTNLIILNTGGSATYDTYCKNMTIKKSDSVVTPTEITQTFNITPTDQSVTINGKNVANNGTLTLSPSTEYTVTAPSGYSVTTVDGVGGNTFTTGTTDGTTAIVLTADAPTTGTISGVVTSSSTSEKLANILVELFLSSDQTNSVTDTTTDENGAYIFENISFGDYIIKFASDSADFISQTLDLAGFNADKTDANIPLTPKTKTVSQTFTISPENQYVTINGDRVANNDSLSLAPNTEYTVTPPDGYSVKSVGGVSGDKFTTGTTDSTTAIVLEVTSSTTKETKWWYMEDKYPGNTSNMAASTVIDYGDDLKYYTGTSTSDKFSDLSSQNLTVNEKSITYGLVQGGSSNTGRRYFTVKLLKDEEITVYVYDDGTSEAYIGTEVSSSGDSTGALATATLNKNSSSFTYKATADNTYYIWGSSGKPYFLAMSKTSADPVTTITGKVVDQNDTAISGATVTSGTISVTSGTDGSFTLKGITAGTNNITATYDGDSAQKSVTVTEGATKDAGNIVITRTKGTIVATVTDTNSGSVIVGAEILFVESVSGVTWTDNKDGTYTSSLIKEGTYTVYATYNGDSSDGVAVTVTPLVDNPVSIPLTSTKGAIQATVKSTDGTLLSGATVTATNINTSAEFNLTETSIGVYEASGVPTGNYKVVAVYGEDTSDGSHYVVAEAGKTN
ncbi:MAG: carboxypeptidase regulatory-like domain-containing protein, partial [Lachnospirales bacterium]